MKIHQAIIPAAGLGTRFLPFTKATPKELLPLLNRSAIEYILEEGIASGIADFFMITSGDKPTLAKYVEPAPELEAALAAKNNSALLASSNRIMAQAHVHYITQEQPLGLGHAVLMAKQAIGENYFGIFLPDDIIVQSDKRNAQAALAQLIEVAQTYNCSVIAVQEVAADQVHNYGIVAIKREVAPGIVELSGLVEKPTQADAPSQLAIIGRYVLSPCIFASLEGTQKGAGNEIQLTDGICHMLRNGEPVYACVVKGTRYDIGTPIGWLSANVDLGLCNPVYAQAIRHVIDAHDSEQR